MEKLIMGTHHIALKAEGVEVYKKTVEFYKDLLGMPLVREWGEGAKSGIMLDSGNCLMEITANGPDSPTSGSIRHIAFLTNEVDQLIERARAAGYEIIMEPRDVTLPATPPYPIRVGFCIGPCKEEVEFFCEK